MLRTLRNFVIPIAVLAVLVTVIGSGMARGQARVAGQIVICSGQNVVTISVDQDGQPVRAVHLCPDCVLSLFSALAPPPDVAGFAPGWASAGYSNTAVFVSGQQDHAPCARAPPVLV